MDPIVLKNRTAQGEPLEAIFLPDKGMNMVHFSRGNSQVIDLSTRDLFEERYAGLGALIGPHFYHRKKELLPKINDVLFPHIARVKAKGVEDPFSHGIGRYAPWQAKFSENTIQATLNGKDTWHDISLAALEGQNFKMIFNVALTPTGLELELSVVSDSDSVVGIHYYFHVPHGGAIYSRVQDKCIVQGKWIPVSELGEIDKQHQWCCHLDKAIDCTLHPFPDPLNGKIRLDAKNYKLNVTYACTSQENSWQLYHPQDASYVCIEPLSAQDPRHPNLTVSSIKIHLEIVSEHL